MNAPFVITGAATSVTLDATRPGTVAFTVTNALGRATTVRAVLRPEPPASAAWFALADGAELPLAINEAHQYNVNISVPAEVAAGTYVFRLDVVGVENPDEIIAQGPPASVVVAAPVVVAKQPTALWMFILPLVVVGIVIAAGAFLALRGGDEEKPAPTATAAPRQPRPTLRQGDRNPEVRELQVKLTDLGFPVQPDGIFGPDTLQKVRQFQQAKGLQVDGVVGPATWTALGFPQ